MVADYVEVVENFAGVVVVDGIVVATEAGVGVDFASVGFEALAEVEC